MTGIITSKEFGKMMQNLRTYACLGVVPLGQDIKSPQLFLKNIADCKSVKTSIISDPCPVQVFEFPVQRGKDLVNGRGNYDHVKVA